MAIEGLTIIAEAINDSVPATRKLFDAGDVDGLLGLARLQDERGAGYIDVNVGPRSPEFMAELVRKIQGVTARPLVGAVQIRVQVGALIDEHGLRVANRCRDQFLFDLRERLIIGELLNRILHVFSRYPRVAQ